MTDASPPDSLEGPLPAGPEPGRGTPNRADAGRSRPSPWRVVAFLAGPLAFVAALVAPLPVLSLDGKPIAATHETRVVLGLTAWMAAWWLTEVLPLAATSLLPLAVLPVAGVMPVSAVAPTYFDEAITLFLGGFCLALAMEQTGLHRRLAHRVVSVAGTKPRGLVLGFVLASGLVSMWVSNTAAALMLLPVATTVVRAVLPGERASRTTAEANFAGAMVLAVAYGASLGGVGTLVGTPPNLIFRGVYNKDWAAETGAPEITFGRWLVIGLPLVIVLLPLAWWLLVRVVLPVPKDLGRGDAGEVLARVRPEGRATFAQRAVFVVFVLTALAWVTRAPIEIGSFTVPGTGWASAFAKPVGGKTVEFVKDGTIAILSALLLFTIPTRDGKGGRLLTWEFAERNLPWGALLLFGGSFALAASFRASGLDSYLAASFGGLKGMPPWAIVTVVAFGMTILSEVASNTAATSMMLPVLLAMAKGIGTDPVPLLLAGTLAASCGFALPIATPPNTLAYGTGEVSVRRMAWAGLTLDVVATIVMILAVLLLAPLAF